MTAIRAQSYRRILDRAERARWRKVRDGAPIRPLLRQSSRLMDALLARIWENLDWPEAENIALVGTGGYGREELFPHSDIDLLILLRKNNAKKYQKNVERFIALLWDMELRVGHSVRSLGECRRIAADDITVITSLMESRRVAGNPVLHEKMMAALSPKKIWKSRAFCEAKLREQETRRLKYSGSAYSLEPNVKHSPGGLRELQTFAWIAQRHFGIRTLAKLEELGILAKSETRLLRNGRNFLWRVRYALHSLGGKQDRLRADLQEEMAGLFGFEDDENLLGVEKFMRQYYRWIMKLETTCGILIQNFKEQVLERRKARPRPLNERWQLRGRLLEVKNPGVFAKNPGALLEAFVLRARDKEIEGFRAATMRLMWRSRNLVDAQFRGEARNAKLFLRLLAEGGARTGLLLKEMHAYGLLGNWLPEFKKITGQLQRDLPPTYTVATHTLQVIATMCPFWDPEGRREFPLASEIMRWLPKPELLFIAGLYHDIAKGRGGDHSLLGAEDVGAFCHRHKLAKSDEKLLRWLVKNHLLMSMTAQRQNIADTKVIARFAAAMGSQKYLDYLYLLTVADIRATNASLWNSWHATLLRELYWQTREVLMAASDSGGDERDRISDARREALRRLRREKIMPPGAGTVWTRVPSAYFLEEKPQDIAWHTAGILAHGKKEGPLVLVRVDDDAETEQIIRIFIYTADRIGLFSKVTRLMESLALRIHGANIFSTADGRTLDTFFVLEKAEKKSAVSPRRLEEIRLRIARGLEEEAPPDIPPAGAPPRRGPHRVPTLVEMPPSRGKQHNVLTVTAEDQPMLLARISRILEARKIQVHWARIATLGMRASDVFHLSDEFGNGIDDHEKCGQIRDAIRLEVSPR